MRPSLFARRDWRDDLPIAEDVHALSLAKMNGEHCRLPRRKRCCRPDEAGLQEAARGPFGTVRRNRGAEISAVAMLGLYFRGILYAGLLAFIPPQRQPRIARLFKAPTQKQGASAPVW
jgi:hypothetical protein